MNKLITKLTLTLAGMVVVNELEQATKQYDKTADQLTEVTKYIGTEVEMTEEMLEAKKQEHKAIIKPIMAAIVGGAIGTLINMAVDKMD